MKKITVAGYESAIDIGHDNPKLSAMELLGPEEMDASDGYHTFSELYDHRVTLYITLCKKVNAEDEMEKSMRAFKEGFSFNRNGWIRKVWRSLSHADGSNFEGWFVLGIDKELGRQITYHLPIARWHETEFAETLERAPEWDKHSSADVLDRLKRLV